jgi:hypothetical protein
MVFAVPSGQLYRDTEILPTYRDFAKTHANPDTDGNFPYRRASDCLLPFLLITMGLGILQKTPDFVS